MDYNTLKKTRANVVSDMNKIVGKGIQLDPMFYRGKSQVNTGVDRVTQSLYCLFSTKRGERLFNPNWGTRIYECLFDQNEFSLCDSVRYFAKEDIRLWEKRIDAEVSVEVVDENSLRMEILYTIKGDTETHSFVFPINREIMSLGEQV